MSLRGQSVWVAIGVALLAAAPAAADPLQQEVRRFADMTVQHAEGGDKVLSFGRRGRDLVVIGMQVVTPDDQPQPPANALAVMRTRAAPTAGSPADMPLPMDFDFARRTGIRLFVVGTWARPAILWEIERDRRVGVHFRTVDAAGRPGAWAVPMDMPADPAPAR